MRYVGRHRAPRPLYLRRPVVGGVAIVLLLGGPALAYGTGSFGKTGNEGALPPAATSSAPDVVVPTDESVVPTSDPDPTAPTTAPSTGTVVETTVDSNGHVTTTTRTTTHSTKPPTTKPPKPTKTKDPDPPAISGLTVNVPATIASGGTLNGSATASGGTPGYTYDKVGGSGWVTVSGGGAIGGTAPTLAAGDDDQLYAVTVKVTDSKGQTKTVTAGGLVKAPEAPPPADPAA
ncbi:hypothetical protein ACIB24_01510 [Spongisporangium articulatum]|uniref:Uncharacterized protein n=1 Tax=Spongisporangium articulatum TaxID=3362603 RepID=A0ABW8AHA1_9ACTN